MTTPALITTAPEIPRDRYGRPLILPDPALVEPGVEPGKPVAYTRASTLGKVLEEQSALTAWKQRMTLLGVVQAPHLAMAASQARDDRSALNKICEEALVAAQAGAKAAVGTALHRIWEQLDRGEDPGPYPAEYRADVEARRRATEGWEWAGIEVFVVCDDLLAAGSADRFRIVRPKGRGKAAQPFVRCVDDKTGSDISYAMLSIGVQLAVYAHGKRYDPATGARLPVYVDPASGDELPVDLKVAEVLHTPSGSGRTTVHEVDIAAGWTAAQLAKSVKGIRTDARHWSRPAGTAEASLADLVSSAPTLEALFALWETRGAEFDGEVGPLASARYALLSAGVVA